MPKLNNLQLNKYITLKLEKGKTVIYVNGVLFRQCKYLILNEISGESLLDYKDNMKRVISDVSETSIDAQTEDSTLGEEIEVDISPEEEFWVHSSNLQAWVESGYDTRLLHRNLAFPLLKKLCDVGDRKAERLFKEEIAFRFEKGSETVRDFLIAERFIDYLNETELWDLFPPEIHIIKEISDKFKLNLRVYTSNDIVLLNKNGSLNQLGFNLKNRKINYISFYKCKLTEDEWSWSLEKLSEIDSLAHLNLINNYLEVIPDNIGNLKNLLSLSIRDNLITEISDSIGNLKRLEFLNVENNKLSLFPDSLGDLISLDALRAPNNKLEKIPDSISKLKSLKYLILNNNNLNSVPESIGNLSLLETVYLSNNNLKSLPNSLTKLKNLKFISLRKNFGMNPPKVLKRLNKKIRIIL